MDTLLSSMVHSLDSHPQVCDIDIKTQTPVLENELSSWEYKHCVFLPTDLKEYYLTQNGMLLTWSIKVGTNIYRVGRVAICELKEMVMIEINHITKQLLLSNLPVKIIRIDENPSVGSICLLYKDRVGMEIDEKSIWEEPIIVLLRHGGKMEFLTKNFTNYLRLMVAYAGLEEWPNRVQGVPLSPVAKQWHYIMGKLTLIED
ncbi:Tubulin polyglutamylase complex subunit 2 isoform X1 [Oopsacas minuta]|uniref:Tubulin polyglutamylase complex subunit 2 isoform X1 n=1 Tax=Oopsacas minuta TaxID=111878 RepID=A0AAV7JMB6_9METZ|nr:Tubulin polyglutamylase complex subunit 2 isoform X1 [Oopsacas minuta]